MEMTQNLPMYQELIQGAPGLGHIPRPMTPEDNTDEGIVQRIVMAVQEGMISPQAGQYLIENLMGGQEETREAMRGMPRPQNMPALSNTHPYGSMRGLLDE